MGRIVATSLPIALFFTLASTVALAQGQSRNLDSLDNDELTAELGRAGSYKQRLQTRETLIARGRQSIPSLADSLETGNEAQKMESLALLQGFRSKASVPKIVPLLRDPDEKVRVRAAFSLGKIGDPVVLPDLIEALANAKSTAMVKSTLAGLGYLGDAKAKGIVVPYLRHEDELVQVTAAGALGLMGSTEGLEIALAASASDDFVVQKHAIFALGLIGGPKAKKRIEELLADPDSHWKSYQRIALYRIELEPLAVSDRTARLQELLDHENKAVAKWAVEQLGEMGSAEAIEVLKERRLESDDIGSLSERALLLLDATN